MDKRIRELLDLVEAEGITLPYPPAVIVGLEERGKYVDLITGMIGDDSDRISVTVVGEAELIAARKMGK